MNIQALKQGVVKKIHTQTGVLLDENMSTKDMAAEVARLMNSPIPMRQQPAIYLRQYLTPPRPIQEPINRFKSEYRPSPHLRAADIEAAQPPVRSISGKRYTTDPERYR